MKSSVSIEVEDLSEVSASPVKEELVPAWVVAVAVAQRLLHRGRRGEPAQPGGRVLTHEPPRGRVHRAADVEPHRAVQHLHTWICRYVDI